MEHKTGMVGYALAFLLGIVCLQQFSILPDLGSLVFLSLSVFFLYLVLLRSRIRFYLKPYLTLTVPLILLILLGIIYSSYYAKQQLAYRLDESLIAKNMIVSGVVSNIPVKNGSSQRFEFSLINHRIAGESNKIQAKQHFPEKIRLSWYYGLPVKAGETWQFEVRLKPPHGFMNPGGFDYEAWLFQHGIHATGYVRKSTLNTRLDKNDLRLTYVTQLMLAINKIRQSLSQKVDALSADTALENPSVINSLSLIKALAVGDKSSITNRQWRVLTDTGTSHLMAISGLHIGLSAFFVYVLIRWLLPVFMMKKIPAQHIAIVAGMLSALLYAMIAGLSVPTQRAIIMLMVLSIMLLIRRNHRPVDSLGFALVLVLLFDPLAVLSVGFWFSFSAVAVIFITLSSRQITEKNSVLPTALNNRWWHKVFMVLKQWVRLQLLITVFLLPLSLFMFQQVSLVSPLANLVLIPYVSFLVVPVVLLAIVSSFMNQYVSELFFNLAASLLDVIWPLLSYLSALPYAVWVRGDVGIVKLLLATSLLLLLYFSRSLSRFIVSYQKRYKLTFVSKLVSVIAVLLFIPLFLIEKPGLKATEYKLTMLDVGQGSSAVIQTRNHALVFDAGAKFSDKLDAGSSVVIPYLRSQGIRFLDYLIISHGDADHIGGAQAILNEYLQAEVIGQDIEPLRTENKQACVQGLKWRWDDVDFEILSPGVDPDSRPFSKKRNNHSCVLQVTSGAGTVLFTGDIEKSTEDKLVADFAGQLVSDILVVPHHGSKTSSGKEFLLAVNPKLSLISVGYKNRYRLPNPKVLAAYTALNSAVMQTDKSGAVTVLMTASDGFSVESYRQRTQKYWHHLVN